MPKIQCKECNGTGDLNHDLPSDEYIPWECSTCRGTGISNVCHECNGRGEVVHGNENTCYLDMCHVCNGAGYQLDVIRVSGKEYYRGNYPKQDEDLKSFGIETDYANGVVILVENTSEYDEFLRRKKKVDQDRSPHLIALLKYIILLRKQIRGFVQGNELSRAADELAKTKAGMFHTWHLREHQALLEQMKEHYVKRRIRWSFHRGVEPFQRKNNV